MLKTKWIQLLLLPFIWHFNYAQGKPSLFFGSLDSSRVSVEEFNMQRDLRVSDGYRIDSAVIYFSGANFFNVQVVNFIPNFDSVKFVACKKLLAPGSAAVFDVLIKKKPTNAPFKVALPFVFYSITKEKSALPNASNEEFKRLLKLDFRSGTVYFSGSNFSNVVSVFIRPESVSEAKKYFERCGPGSIITFDNVTIKDERNNLSKINMTLKLE